MKINQELIIRLEALARLELSATERATITQDLERILDMVAQLQTIDTENVEPLVYIAEEVNVLRNDEIKDAIDRTRIMKNAPLSDTIFFKVPKMIDK